MEGDWTCSECGYTEFEDGDDGFFYCARCSSQVQGFRNTYTGDEDDVHTGKYSKEPVPPFYRGGVLIEKSSGIMKKQRCNVGEDKISNLPDELIHHILSFLPTKFVLSTCILSKRWKSVSNSIPNLDFSKCCAVGGTIEDKRSKTQQFMDFVDTVLRKPNIRKFCLIWDEHFDENRVKRWISILIKRKVEELVLSVAFLQQTFLKFPESLFTCDSLGVLDLHRTSLNVPNTVSFPRLKILRLSYIYFVNGDPYKLVSNCPILEELCLISCGSSKSQALCIANLSLKNLYIRTPSLRKSTVEIYAPNLLTISYGQGMPVDFVINSFHSLVEADIDILPDKEKISVVIKLFKKLANVRHLKMSYAYYQVISEADILLPDLPTFNNLKHLEVESITNVRRFFRFLQLSPNLESIVFAKSAYFYGKEHDDCSALDPKCSPQYLKSIKFNNFSWQPKELDAIKLFLKNAGYLETVTIVACPWISKDHKEQLRIAKLLLMFPKPANCVVKFLTTSEDL